MYKVKLTNKALRHKVVSGVNVYTQVSLTSALFWDEWLASLPGRFTLGERAQQINKHIIKCS
jgi:hypothetical protein